MFTRDNYIYCLVSVFIPSLLSIITINYVKSPEYAYYDISGMGFTSGLSWLTSIIMMWISLVQLESYQINHIIECVSVNQYMADGYTGYISEWKDTNHGNQSCYRIETDVKDRSKFIGKTRHTYAFGDMTECPPMTKINYEKVTDNISIANLVFCCLYSFILVCMIIDAKYTAYKRSAGQLLPVSTEDVVVHNPIK